MVSIMLEQNKPFALVANRSVSDTPRVAYAERLCICAFGGFLVDFDEFENFLFTNKILSYFACKENCDIAKW